MSLIADRICVTISEPHVSRIAPSTFSSFISRLASISHSCHAKSWITSVSPRHTASIVSRMGLPLTSSDRAFTKFLRVVAAARAPCNWRLAYSASSNF
ncbi:MAG: hypothetical protein ACK55I_13735 [bacterium]